jgi:hypothetical protein
MLFEHAGVRVGRSFRYTLWRSLRPWSFWRWVRIEHEVVADRLAVFAVLGPIVAYLIGALGVAVVGSLARLVLVMFEVIYIWSGAGFTDLLLGCFVPGPWPFAQSEHLWAIVYGGAMLALVIAPGVLFVLGDSLRSARVRRINLLRVWAYSLLVVGLMHAVTVACLTAATLVFIAFFGHLLHGNPDPVAMTVLRAASWTIYQSPWLGAAVGVLWLFVGLRAAARSYLRLPHAGGIAAAAVVIGMLVGAVVGVLAWIVLWEP